MPKREKSLRSCLEQAGETILASAENASRQLGALNSETARLEAVFARLCGRGSSTAIRLGNWDLALTDCVVELDKEQHFNRYRAATLDCDFYADWRRFDVRAYREHCLRFEPDCLRKAANRGYWSTLASARQFGEPNPVADLSGAGAPRWRQRAFNDFRKDLIGFVTGLPVVRLSVYESIADELCSRSLGAALDRPTSDTGARISSLIRARLE